MVVRAVTRRLPASASVLGSLSTANCSCGKALRLETRRVFPPCPMENRAAAAHAETSKTWTRLLDQGAHRLTEVGQLKAPVDYAQAGATTPAPSRKTRRQDMHGTETNEIGRASGWERVCQ